MRCTIPVMTLRSNDVILNQECQQRKSQTSGTKTRIAILSSKTRDLSSFFQGRQKISNIYGYGLLHTDAFIIFPHINGLFPNDIEKRVIESSSWLVGVCTLKYVFWLCVSVLCFYNQRCQNDFKTSLSTYGVIRIRLTWHYSKISF